MFVERWVNYLALFTFWLGGTIDIVGNRLLNGTCLICLVSTVNVCSKNIGLGGASSGHITNIKQSIFSQYLWVARKCCYLDPRWRHFGLASLPPWMASCFVCYKRWAFCPYLNSVAIKSLAIERMNIADWNGKYRCYTVEQIAKNDFAFCIFTAAENGNFFS